MFGVSFGCLVPMRGAVGSIMFGTRAIGKVLGLLQGGPIAAGVIGPLVMGMIFDLHGNYSAAIWGLIVTSALMVPVSLAMASPAELAKRIEQRLQKKTYMHDGSKASDEEGEACANRSFAMLASWAFFSSLLVSDMTTSQNRTPRTQNPNWIPHRYP